MAVFNIEMYGVFRRLAQAEEIQIQIDSEDVTVEVLLDKLTRQYPEMINTLETTAVAIGDELVSRDTSLLPDQRLALIPPVSGGQ